MEVDKIKQGDDVLERARINTVVLAGAVCKEEQTERVTGDTFRCLTLAASCMLWDL